MLTKQILVLFLFFLDVALCLVCIKRNKPHGYTVAKPFLMPLLLCVYFTFLPPELREMNDQRLVALALAFHTLGDILLIFPRNKTKMYFYMGMAAFFVGHVFYAAWFFKADVGHSKQCAIIILIACIILEYLLYRQLMLGPRKYAPKLLPYSWGLVAVAVSIGYSMGNGSLHIATVISLLGVALFCFSDYNILRRLVRMPLFGQMMVMSTYIAGQSLIILGMLLLQIC